MELTHPIPTTRKLSRRMELGRGVGVALTTIRLWRWRSSVAAVSIWRCARAPSRHSTATSRWMGGTRW